MKRLCSLRPFTYLNLLTKWVFLKALPFSNIWWQQTTSYYKLTNQCQHKGSGNRLGTLTHHFCHSKMWNTSLCKWITSALFQTLHQKSSTHTTTANVRFWWFLALKSTNRIWLQTILDWYLQTTGQRLVSANGKANSKGRNKWRFKVDTQAPPCSDAMRSFDSGHSFQLSSRR